MYIIEDPTVTMKCKKKKKKKNAVPLRSFVFKIKAGHFIYIHILSY